jgi:hypothetical protein
MLEEELFAADTSKKELTDTVIDCLNEEDLDSLKSYFCIKSQNMEDIDTQILSAIKLVDGNIISYNDKLMGSEGKSTEYGRTTDLERRWSVKEILTDSEKKYEFYIDVKEICENDNGKVGIQRLFVEGEDGSEVRIGYDWPDYYHEGSGLARKLVTALGNNDLEIIKSLLSQEAQKQSNISDQIENAIFFFKGQAYMGRIEGDGLEYDGKHDYSIRVTDDEIVVGGEPIETSIAVYCTNIETNADRVYEMDIYSYIKNDVNPNFVGISNIILRDEVGNTIIVGEKVD